MNAEGVISVVFFTTRVQLPQTLEAATDDIGHETTAFLQEVGIAQFIPALQKDRKGENRLKSAPERPSLRI
jgi:hypothetical protein